MKRVYPAESTTWQVAKKTKNILAKPLVSLLVDQSVRGKFLLETLEGTQALGNTSIACLGVENDIWQQTPAKLLAKYDVVDFTETGWMVCRPKPDNEINVFRVTDEMTDAVGKFYIIGQWGKESSEGPRQEGVAGDWVGQNQNDPDDVWIIVRKIFNSTYEFVIKG